MQNQAASVRSAKPNALRPLRRVAASFNQSIEPTGGSRFCLSEFANRWRLPPVAHAGYAGPASTLFVPESGSRYSVSLEFSPSNEVSYATIGKNDGYILDGFTCTNGIFHPDELSHISEINRIFEQATGELRKK